MSRFSDTIEQWAMTNLRSHTCLPSSAIQSLFLHPEFYIQNLRFSPVFSQGFERPFVIDSVDVQLDGVVVYGAISGVLRLTFSISLDFKTFQTILYGLTASEHSSIMLTDVRREAPYGRW